MDFDLPLLDEPVPPSMGQYSQPHTKAWAAKIDSFDGYVFVTPEYNHGISGALKNAIDFLYREWNNKAAGFVGYGSAGGVRAVESLRLVMGELQVADVRNQVMLSLFSPRRKALASRNTRQNALPTRPSFARLTFALRELLFLRVGLRVALSSSSHADSMA
jgi:NAD(P)H-dependent FMN reductase